MATTAAGTANGTAQPEPSRRQYAAVMTATILGSAIAFIDGSIVSVAMPAIRDGLGASLTQMQWIVNGYALMLAAFILPGGAAGDAFGRRFVFMAGVALFSLASLWCALARSPAELIVARVFAGIGGALMIPASLALITVTVPKARRGAAIGLWAGAGAIATAAGPILGGTLVDSAGWRFALLIVVPIGLVTFLVALAVPESRAGARRMDWAGGFLACAALGMISFALTSLVGDDAASALITGIAGAVLTVVFLGHQANAAAPMMPLTLFAVTAFAGANALTFLVYGGLSAVLFLLPILLIDVHGYSAAAAGLSLLPFTLVIAALSRYSGTLVDRVGARLPLTLGPLIVALSLALLVPVARSGEFWLQLMPVMVVFGLGMGLTAAPLSATVMNAVDEDFAGVASGVNNAVSRAAGLIFVAAAGIVAQAGFVAAGAAGRFGEPGTAGAGYDEGMIAGFTAVTLTCAVLSAVAGLIAWLSLSGEKAAAA